MPHPDSSETTYSLGAVAKLTGLSPHVLRAWERRYAAVEPLRTAGGTRRYREADIARLRLLSTAVQAGHAIGDLSKLDEKELRRRLEPLGDPPQLPLRAILETAERMDHEALERALGFQLAALGPRRFIERLLAPLLHTVGERWRKGSLCVASEHLISSCARNLLGSTMRRMGSASRAPVVLFSTLVGDRHELGTLACAVVAAELGANAVYLGPDLPAFEVAETVEHSRAGVLALGLSEFAGVRQRERGIREILAALPDGVDLWVGGSGVRDLRLPAEAELVENLDRLEEKVSLLPHRPKPS